MTGDNIYERSRNFILTDNVFRLSVKFVNSLIIIIIINK